MESTTERRKGSKRRRKKAVDGTAECLHCAVFSVIFVDCDDSRHYLVGLVETLGVPVRDQEVVRWMSVRRSHVDGRV